MPSRRDLIKKAKRPVESVAGTIASAYSSAKDKAAVRKIANAPSEDLREATSKKREQTRAQQQEQARLEKARQEARARAAKKARTEFYDEFEDELVKELKAEELARLNQKFGDQMPVSRDQQAARRQPAPEPVGGFGFGMGMGGFDAGGDFMSVALANPFDPAPPQPAPRRRGGGRGRQAPPPQEDVGAELLGGIFGVDMGMGMAPPPDTDREYERAPRSPLDMPLGWW